MKPPRTPHEAIVVPTAGPIYHGRAGQTRTERVHLVDDDGSVRSIEVYRVVNVATHTELKPRVLAGLLHRLDDGRELAVPYVYHDPTAHKFALVIPPALAHLEMKEWARLMTEVAEDTRDPVPAYVRDGTTVLGLGALELFLESGFEPEDVEFSDVARAASARDAEFSALERTLREREQQLAERTAEAAGQEQNLVRMATDLTARENSVARREQQLATARADLDARDADRVDPRTEPPTQQAARLADAEWREVRAAEATSIAPDQATVVMSVDEINKGKPLQSVSDSELHEMRSVVEVHAAPPPLRRRPANVPPPLAPLALAPLATMLSAATSSLPPPPLARHARSEPIAGNVRANDSASVPPPLRGASQEPPEPPAGFLGLPPLQMALHHERHELWLFVALDARTAEAFDEEAELLAQLVEIDDHPVVVLVLLGAGGRIARVALDGLLPETRAAVERLERVFRATIVLYVGKQLRAQRSVLAPREANARAMLERLARPRPTSRTTGAQAIARVLHDPPKVRDDEMPFGPPRPQAASTASVQLATQRLEAWTEPHKLEEALLRYSVPKHVVEASVRRLLRAAIGFGVALTPRLRELAIEHKLAESPGQVVTEQLAAFKQRIERGQNDLDAEATLRNWKKLFAQGDELDLLLDRELRPWVENTVRASGFPSPDLPLSSAELRRDLGDPGRRLDAIRELCRRGHPSTIAPIFEVLDELSPEEVAGAVVALLSYGGQVADGLSAALGSHSQHVRHACALSLAQLKLGRSLPALLHQVQAESTPSWVEMARALGEFGLPALRSVTAALQTSDRRERLMVSLAHLANHGCLDEIQALESDTDSTVALAARQALARRTRIEEDDQAIRNQQPLRDHSPESRFSQVFFAEFNRTQV